MTIKINNNEIQLQRSDLAAIRDMIPQNAHILDLGCGSGRLLYALKTLKHAKVMGVENDQQTIPECAARGIPVIHASLDAALTDFRDGSYDYVILSRTIQSVQRPDIILNEMLRIGKRGIVNNPKAHIEVLRSLVSFAPTLGWQVQTLDFSPITGGDGNIEFLADLVPASRCRHIVTDDDIHSIVKHAHAEMK